MKIALFRQGGSAVKRPTKGARPQGPKVPHTGPRPGNPQQYQRPVKKAVKKAARAHEFTEFPEAARKPVKKAAPRTSNEVVVRKAVKKAVKKVARIANTLQEINQDPNRIGLTDQETLQTSVVGKNVAAIQSLLEEGNFETATNTVHKSLLQTLIDLIPFAEQAVRESRGQRGLYQINSLSSMILETLNSARAQADRGQLAQHLVERVIQPAFKTLAEDLVREFMVLDADLSTARPGQDRELARETRNRIATRVQGMYNTISTELQKFLSG